MRIAIVVLVSAGLMACQEDAETPAPAAPDVVVDAVPTADPGFVEDDVPAPFTRPDWFPSKDAAADETVALAGLDGPVQVVTDDRGIPHIYGETPHDLAMAQGYVTARARMFQMDVLRKAASGRLAELLGPASLSGDVFLRTLHLRTTAVAMAEKAKTDDPELFALLEAFAAGVNAHIADLDAGRADAPPEIVAFKLKPEPWTPADTMTIVRLQTWDLGFGGIYDDLSLFNLVAGVKEKFAGTPLEGAAEDVLRFSPVAKAATLAPPATKPGAHAFDLAQVLRSPLFTRLRPETRSRMASVHREMEALPHHLLRTIDYGSNNWVVSGKHTASGKPIVANDTHLALRNPAVFYHVALSNVPAGGDFDVSGVNFAGAPGIVLGNNAHGAWGATVFYSDVTDVYVEDYDPTAKTVMFNGKAVPLTIRKETFRTQPPGDGKCESTITGWMANLSPETKAVEGIGCEVTVTVEDVPHHGPIIPWSYDTDKDGKPIAMSWRWTGFDATTELSAVWRLNKAKNVADFKAALDWFGVGAQNWIWGDVDGHIAWYPSHLLPKRTAPEKNPPFLPLPGDGSAEWDGYVERSALPQSTDPDKGWLATANADPIGVSFDDDPFNDGPYLGAVWDTGLRIGRIDERLKGLVQKGGITAEDLQAVQGDHYSNLGAIITPYVLAALDGAGDLTAEVGAAKELLAGWTFEAESGVGEPAGSVKAKDAAATAVFNVMLTFLSKRVLADEGLTALGDQLVARLLVRMLAEPEKMKTWDATTKQCLLWDDVTTTDHVETQAEMILLSVADAVAFLSDPKAVGVKQKGGFGTADTSLWRWGALHTVRLKHNLAPSHHIPPFNDPDYADGFPRPGDNFSVDASHPGMSNTDFTYGSGPAIRNVYTLGTPVAQLGVIPGGQDENPFKDHYKDEMARWWKNEAPAVPFAVADVLAAKERVLDLTPAAK